MQISLRLQNGKIELAKFLPSCCFEKLDFRQLPFSIPPVHQSLSLVCSIHVSEITEVDFTFGYIHK